MQPISSDLMQMGIVKESAYGVTPANPVFDVLPITGESLTADVATTNSAMMNPDRQVLDSILQSITAAGSITTELAVTPALKILVESAMSSALVPLAPAITGLPPAEETVIGKDQISFTVEKRFPDPVNPGSFLYHRFPGCVVNTMTVSVAPGEAATISFGVISTTLTPDTVLFPGALYMNPQDILVLRGPDVISLAIDGANMTTDCFGDFSMELNNNYRGIQCLGVVGNKNTVVGRAEVALAARVGFQSNALLNLLLAQTETTADIEMKTGVAQDPGAYFAMHFPRIKITGDAVVAGGTGDDVVNDLTAQALDNVGGTKTVLGTNDADKTSMRVVLGLGTLTP